MRSLQACAISLGSAQLAEFVLYGQELPRAAPADAKAAFNTMKGSAPRRQVKCEQQVDLGIFGNQCIHPGQDAVMKILTRLQMPKELPNSTQWTGLVNSKTPKKSGIRYCIRYSA